MNLLQRKQQAKIATQGVDLLKRKRDALVADFFNIVRQALTAREQLTKISEEAYVMLALAKAWEGREALEAAAMADRRDVLVDIDVRNVWGTKIPEVAVKEVRRTLLERGVVVVAIGGGGIPVVTRDGRHDGVDAVIDKDHASALLAVGLGAERLVILTQVPAVYEGFETGDRRAVAELRPGRDDEIVERLPAGSMRPKVEAAFRFVRETGGEALITSADALEKGEAGTRIVPASANVSPL